MSSKMPLAAVLFLGLSAAVAHANPPHVSKAMTFPPGEDVPPQTQFKPDTPQITLGLMLHDFKPGDKVTAIWIAEKTKVAPPDYKIDSATVTVGTSEGIAFRLSKPNNGWPVGDYRVDITYNGQKEYSQHFKVIKAE